MTHFGGGHVPDDDDPDIIEGEAREIDDDHGPRTRWFDRFRRRSVADDPVDPDDAEDEDGRQPRRISLRKLLLLALALVGAILLALAFSNACGGGDSQSPDDTDSPTAVPTEVEATPEPTKSATATSTPTSTPTSVVVVPTATVRADTGDPLGLTGGSSGSGGIVMFALALLVAASCVWIFFRKTGPKA